MIENRLGLEHQTVLGLPPVEFVHLAADLGCGHVAIMLAPLPYNPHGYEPYSLREDVVLRRRLVVALRDRGLSISLGEGFLIHPGGDIRAAAADLDTMAELGAVRINGVSMDPDAGRTLDEFAVLAEMVAQRGMETTVEFAPSLTVKDLHGALDVVRHVGRPDFRLLIDTMHVVRAGNTAADLAALDPALVGHVQLSDNTLRQRGAVYRDDSGDRMAPGDGELPLREILAALPPRVPIGLEVPMRSRAEAGEPTRDRARRCVQAARALLAARDRPARPPARAPR